MNIFDPAFSSLVDIDMYRNWVYPEFGNDRPARLENWHPEDLAAYCGGEFTN